MKIKLLAAAAAVALTGCQDLPTGLGSALLGSVAGSSQVVRGTVASPQANLRVGLLAQPQAGGAHVELSSASASSGSYAIQLNQPGPDMLQSDETKSYVFVLTPYVDVNGDGKYEDGIDRTVDGGGQSFRWFAKDDGTTKAGWNVFDGGAGTYSQSFAGSYNV